MLGRQNVFWWLSFGSGSSSYWFAWFLSSDDSCGQCLMLLMFAETCSGSLINLVLALMVSWTVMSLMAGSVRLAASSAAPQHCGLTSDLPSSGGPGPPPCHSATTGKISISNFWRQKKSLTSTLAVYSIVLFILTRSPKCFNQQIKVTQVLKLVLCKSKNKNKNKEKTKKKTENVQIQ